ncbi:MAG: hypothetical protein ABIJ97_17040 [Bacteroidota bacterium]
MLILLSEKSNTLKFRLLLILLFVNAVMFSQSRIDSAMFIPMFKGVIAYQIPGGDLSRRFGNNFSTGGGFQIKTKSNILFSAECTYLFGNKLKNEATSVLNAIMTSDGQIIDQNGEFATVLLTERGFYAGGRTGLIIPVFGSNPNSGVLITGGLGFLQHKIRIENDGNRAPQILNEYKKGYDKLTNGLFATESIGYMYIGKNQILNFAVEFEFYQAWTKCRRNFNFDTMEKDDEQRLDMLGGLKISWLIPLYKRMADGYYYN